MADFWGNFATSTEDNRQRWAEINMRREEAEHMKGIRERQITLQEDQFNWQEEIEGLRLDWDQDRFREEQLYTFFQDVRANWGDMSSGERLGVLHAFEASPFAGTDAGAANRILLEAQIRDTMSPANAKEFLFSFFNADYGTEFPEFALREALRAVEGTMDPDEFRELKKDATEWQTVLREGREEEFDTQRRLSQFQIVERETAVEEGLANARRLTAEAETTDATREAIVRNLDLVNEGTALTNEGMELTNQAQALQLEALPEQLRLGLAGLAQDVARGEIDIAILEATFDDVVEQMAIQTGLGREELRHQLATATARDAILRGEADQAKVMVDVLRSQEEANYASARASDATITRDQFIMKMQRYEMIDALMEAGNVEMLREVGPEILEPILGDRTQATIDAIVERTADVREDYDSIQAARVIVAQTEARISEETADDVIREARAKADVSDYESEFWLDNYEHRQEIEHFRNQTDRIQANAYARQVEGNIAANAHKAGGVGVSTTEAHNAARLATSTSVSDLIEDVREWSDLLADYVRLEDLSDQDLVVEVSRLADEYGFSNLTADNALEWLGNRADNVYNSLLRKFTLYDTQMVAQGHPPDWFEYGLDVNNENDMRLWNDIWGRRSNTQIDFLTFSGAQAEVSLSLQPIVIALTPQFADSPLTELSYAEIYEEVRSHVGDDELLAEAGINSPADLIPFFDDEIEQYRAARTDARQAMPVLEALGMEVDWNDHQSLRAAEREVSRRADSLVSLGGRIPQIPEFTHRSVGQATAENVALTNRFIFELGDTLGMSVPQMVEYGYISEAEWAQHHDFDRNNDPLGLFTIPQEATDTNAQWEDTVFVINKPLISQVIGTYSTWFSNSADGFNKLTTRY